jgi:hypothetical protein
MNQIKLYISFCQVLKIYLITKRIAQIKIALVLKIALHLIVLFFYKDSTFLFKNRTNFIIFLKKIKIRKKKF